MFCRHFLYFSPQKKLLPFIKLLVQAADQDCRHLGERREAAADPDSSGNNPDLGFCWCPWHYLLGFGAAEHFLDSQPLRLHIFIFILITWGVGELPGFGFCKTFPKGKKTTGHLGSAFRWDLLAAWMQKAICVR